MFISDIFCKDHFSGRCPYLSMSCVYCRGKHVFDDCSYDTDSLFYIGQEGSQKLLNPFPNELKG